MSSEPVPDPHSSYLELDKCFTSDLFDGIEGFQGFLRALEAHAHQVAPCELLAWLTANYDFEKLGETLDLTQELGAPISNVDAVLERIDTASTLADLRDTPDFELCIERYKALMDALRRINANNHAIYQARGLYELPRRLASARTFTEVAGIFSQDLFFYACYASRLQVAQAVAVALTRGSEELIEHGKSAYMDAHLGRATPEEIRDIIWLKKCIQVYRGVIEDLIELPINRENLARFVFTRRNQGIEYVGMVTVHVQIAPHNHLIYLLHETCRLARAHAELWRIQRMMLAFAMGRHPRLGRASLVYKPDTCLISQIAHLAFPELQGLLPFAQFRVDLPRLSYDNEPMPGVER